MITTYAFLQMRVRRLAGALVLGLSAELLAFPGPFDGRDFAGRIAYSADGNFNDPDDWAASPLVLAILGSCGVQGRLVHFDYNCILPKTRADWERKHADGILGAARHYGFDLAVFHDCQTELDAAVGSIRDAINASSASDPLYYVIAGPVEVPYLGIAASDPAKRRFVYCLSHNCWNDGYASGDLVAHNKRDVIPTGVHWVQITDQNRRLAFGRYGRPARPEEFAPYFWMRDATDPRIRFLWERMVVSTRPDPSDSGMAWFLLTGSEVPSPSDYRALIRDGRVPPVVDPRQHIRLEAENFRDLDGFAVEYRNDRRASQRINVRSTGTGGAHIATAFREPYTAPVATYDVQVRYRAEDAEPRTLSLSINGRPYGLRWAAGTGDWTSHTVRGVPVADGDRVAVGLAPGGGRVRLDYVGLQRVRSRAEVTAVAATWPRPERIRPEAALYLRRSE